VIPPSVPLAISINGISHTSSSRVFTFETLALHSASPRGSPHPGGTLLSIRGEGFRRPSHDGCDCRCRFRATDGGSVTVPARYISSSLVICIVPPANGAHHPQHPGILYQAQHLDTFRHFVSSPTFGHVRESDSSTLHPTHRGRSAWWSHIGGGDNKWGRLH